MSADEPVRIRLHRRLAELLDEELADAMMESMPPMPWDQLATKDDIARLDARLDRMEGRFENVEGRFEHVDDRFDTLIERMDSRFDGLSERIDAQIHNVSGEMALLEGRLSVRDAETTRMIVFAMMTLFVGVAAVLAATLA